MLALTQKKWMPRALAVVAKLGQGLRGVRGRRIVEGVGIEQRRAEHPPAPEQTMRLRHAERLRVSVRLDDVARVDAAHVRAQRAGEAVGIVAV